MQKMTLKSKLHKLGPGRLVFALEPVCLKHEDGKPLFVRSLSFRLPLDTVDVEALAINGRVVYKVDMDLGAQRTAPLGGQGGRFFHQRRYLDRQLVEQVLTLRDLPTRSSDLPKVEVVLSRPVQKKVKP